MPKTILVEPYPGGHRSQAVANVAAVAARTGDVLVLTSKGASEDPTFQEYLGHTDHPVEECFSSLYPSTMEVAREIASRADRHTTVVVMDADQALKRWWYAAPLAFGVRRRPRVVFMLTRYPAKLALTDWVGWKLRVPKALLALVAMCTGSLHRVAGFAGRDDMTQGWIVKRTRDPAICTAHSQDRAALREELGLDPDRRIVGIFGGVSERKYPDLVWDALQTRKIEADLLLAGGLSDGVAAWVEATPGSSQSSIVLRPGFLSNEVLDKLVAAADVVALAMTNNGPSGIMGKALAAGVPVVTAGSEVRAQETRATGAGETADFNAESIGAAIERALQVDALRPSTVPPATAEEFAERILGI